MTFNSSQQERLLAALERIADALEGRGPGQPGKNGGERAGLAGRELLPVAPDARTDPDGLFAHGARGAVLESIRFLAMWRNEHGYPDDTIQPLRDLARRIETTTEWELHD